MEDKTPGTAPDLDTEEFDTLFAHATDRQDYLPLVHAVFRQIAKVVALSAAAFIGTDPSEMRLPREQAICAGLLVRVATFMRAVALLSADRSSGDVILALNRCIFDGASAVLFLIEKDDVAVYDRFVRHSLAPERQLHNVIIENVGKRGHQLLVEARMLESIELMCRTSGVTITEIAEKPGPWDGGMRQPKHSGSSVGAGDGPLPVPTRTKNQH